MLFATPTSTTLESFNSGSSNRWYSTSCSRVMSASISSRMTTTAPSPPPLPPPVAAVRFRDGLPPLPATPGFPPPPNPLERRRSLCNACTSAGAEAAAAEGVCARAATERRCD
eukprot:1179718-Prorocentrum_minimum.AAC.3